MDPLSATASVVAVLQLAADVVGYISAAKGASKEWKRLSYEVLGCELILERIEDDLGPDEPGDTDLKCDSERREGVKALESIGGPLGRLWTALSFVKDKIEPTRGLRKALSTVRWPFDAKEVEKIIAAVEREKALLNLALTSDSRRLIREVKESSAESSKQLLDLLKDLEASSSKALASIQESQTTLRAGIDQLRQRNDDLERDVVLGWLSPSNYPSQHADLLRRRQPGTGQWILDSKQYEDWFAAKGRTLFCPGIPGAGKTILTSIVVDDLDTKFGNDPRVGIAYVYCNFRRKEEDADYLSLALLKQLYQQQPYLPDDAYKLYRQFKPKQAQPPFLDIAQGLSSVMGLYSRVFILVDALDEADSHQRARFVRGLFALQSECKVNIFATSRFIPDIVKEFSSASFLEIRASNEDIERYLDGRMPEMPCFPDWSERLQKEIKSKILEAVDGMFILAEIYLTSLEDKATPRAVRSTLSQFERQIPGSTEVQRREVLDKAYQAAMERITGQKPGFRTLALKALCWITCAARPLAPPELQHALAVEVGDSELDEDNIPRLERMVSICAGLVTIDEESHIIRLVHYTTQEFFQERWGDWFPTAHDDIETVCITYLSFKHFKTGMCPTYEEYRERLRSYPLYLYATSHLGQHYHKASKETQEAVIEFFDKASHLEAAVQAWHVADRKPDESKIIDEYFDVQNKKDGLYLATCLGLEDVIQLLLRKRTGGVKGSSAEAIPGDDPGTTAGGVTDGPPLPPDDLAEDGEDDITGQLLKVIGDQQKFETMRSAGYTLLHIAVKHLVEDAVKHLLDQGYDIEAKSPDGYTPLHVASEVYTPAIDRLLQQNSTEGEPPTDAEPADDESADDESADDKPADDQPADDKPVSTPAAVKKGTDIVAALLIERGAEINSRDSQERTPLHIAARAGNEAVTKLLIIRGADIEAKDAKGRTPLLTAVNRPVEHESPTNLAVIELLLNKGADTEAKFNGGWTPLLAAVRYDLCKVSKLLLEKGAKIDAVDDEGCTPLSIARKLRSWDMIKLLQDWMKARAA